MSVLILEYNHLFCCLSLGKKVDCGLICLPCIIRVHPLDLKEVIPCKLFWDFLGEGIGFQDIKGNLEHVYNEKIESRYT